MHPGVSGDEGSNFSSNVSDFRTPDRPAAHSFMKLVHSVMSVPNFLRGFYKECESGFVYCKIGLFYGGRVLACWSSNR